MITRILLGLDATASSTMAADLAFELAATHGAALEALAVIDTPFITRPMAVGIGGAAHKVATETAELRQAHAGASEILERVQAAARARGLACTTRTEEGDPPDVLSAAAVASDLIVLGHDAAFWGKEATAIAPAVQGLLAHNPRPVLVAPSTPLPGSRVLVAFDGSLAASRALHMAALLGIGTGRHIVVLSIGEAEAEATRRAEAAAKLLRAHGADVEDVIGMASSADPADLILAEIRALHAGISVMGAYGHTGLREVLFGSCTRTLLRACPTALFVHH